MNWKSLLGCDAQLPVGVIWPMFGRNTLRQSSGPQSEVSNQQEAGGKQSRSPEYRNLHTILRATNSAWPLKAVEPKLNPEPTEYEAEATTHSTIKLGYE
jgi:hypothetical protein